MCLHCVQVGHAGYILNVGLVFSEVTAEATAEPTTDIAADPSIDGESDLSFLNEFANADISAIGEDIMMNADISAEGDFTV